MMRVMAVNITQGTRVVCAQGFVLLLCRIGKRDFIHRGDVVKKVFHIKSINLSNLRERRALIGGMAWKHGLMEASKDGMD